MLSVKFVEAIKIFCGFTQKKEKSEDCIFVEDNDKLLLIANEKYLSAKVIGDNLGTNVYVLSNKRTKDRENMIESYRFKRIYLDSIKLRHLIYSIIRSFILITKADGETILDYSIEGIKCGDLIYDSIIMRCNHVFTLTSLKNRIALREVILMHYTYYCIKEQFNRYNPRLFIAQDLVYRDGFISRYAKKYGADIMLLTTGRPSYLIKANEKIDICFPRLYENSIREAMVSLEEDWEEQANDELDRLYQGKWDWNAQNAFKNKIVTDKETLLTELGINNGKKNIVVMAHCFSDAPHGNGSGSELYKDYYTWLKSTIEIAERIDDVNWLVRPHPSRVNYGEEGVVEALCEGKNGITIMPDKYSTLMVAKVADCVITVNGSAGMELPCMGVPCINAGKPFYSNFGFSICPNSIEEYEEVLRNSSSIRPLSEKQVQEAKKVLLLFHRIARENDDYYDACYKIHQQYCVDKDVEAANREYIELFYENVKSGKIKTTYNYKYANQLTLI